MVVGVPKTIDNDILLIDRTFGFDTAVEEAQKAINSAYIEVQLLTRSIWSVFLKCEFESVLESNFYLCYAGN